jgi:lipopolysaccharide assembly outer membrane protein LptD (OstA)
MLLFPYSNSCLARILSQETSASFSNDFITIYDHIAKTVKLMLEKEDESEDMNDANEGKALLLG